MRSLELREALLIYLVSVDAKAVLFEDIRRTTCYLGSDDGPIARSSGAPFSKNRFY